LILSCHNEFDYVKQALKLGAFDYILKLSLNTEELIHQLNLMKEKTRSSSDYRDPRKLVADYIHRLINHLPCDDYQTDEVIIHFGQLLAKGDYQLYLVDLNNRAEQDLSVVLNIVIETLNKAILTKDPWFYGILDNFRLVFLLSGLPDDQMDGLANLIIANLMTYINVPFFIGISSPFSGREKIGEALHQAEIALHQQFYAAEERIFRYNTTSPLQINSLVERGIEDKLFNHIEMMNFDEVKRQINEIFEDNYHSKNHNPNSLLNNMIVITNVFAKYLRLFGLSLGDIAVEYNNFYDTILHTKKLTDLQIVYNRFIDDFSQKAGELKKLKNHNDIVKAKAFITDNYQKPIRLEDVARHVNMSPSYFSSMFKKSTADNYVNYLNKIRVEKAKMLFQTGKYKISEVAGMVGYNNTNYFYKIFKKVTGSQPNNYK